MKEDKTTLQA